MEIVLPTTTQGKSNLYKAIRAKVLADGTSGECYDFIIAQEIDVNADYNSTLDALVHEENNDSKISLKEYNNSCFYKTLDATNTVSRGIAQELKILLSPNFKDGGLFGIDFSSTGAVNFPTKQADQIALFRAINKYYLTFAPDPCIIDPYLVAKGYVMATIALALTDAEDLKDDAFQLNLDAMLETSERNKDMATPEINIHKFANFLQTRHPDDGRWLGLYGFVTSDAPAKEKDQISSVPIGKNKQLQHIVLGSTMVNMTGDPVIVHKGKKKKGIGITIPGHGELLMGKGFANVVVVSTNPLQGGIIRVRVRR